MLTTDVQIEAKQSIIYPQIYAKQYNKLVCLLGLIEYVPSIPLNFFPFTFNQALLL